MRLAASRPRTWSCRYEHTALRDRRCRNAGPAIAARLTEDPAVEVVLLEAGEENTYEAGRAQGAFFQMFGSEPDWNYETTPQSGIGGMAITHPRGKVVGGSCALNVGA
jgi:choline dehydrogenase